MSLSGISGDEILESKQPFQGGCRAGRHPGGLEMKNYSSPVLLFLSIIHILPALLDENPPKCVFEVWGERRENVSSGSEFCWSWPSFSCPSLTEQTVRERENITLCCSGYHEDTEGNCIEMEGGTNIEYLGKDIELERV